MPESNVPETALGDLFRLERGTVTPASSPNEEFVHFSLPAFDETGTAAIEQGAAIESAKTEISDRCVLVSKLNPRKPRALVANPANDPRRHCASTEFMVYVPRTNGLDVGYYRWLLGSSVFQRRLERVATGTTNSHVRARPSETLGWSVPHPPLPEQRQIAEILDTIDEAIRKTEEIIAKLKQVKQGLLHDLLTRGIDDNGELRDPDRHPEQFKDSPLGRIPREWEVASIENVCSDIVDCPHTTPVYVETGIPCIRTADMMPGRLLLGQARKVTEATYLTRTQRLVPKEGDIIYSREGERLGIASPVGVKRVCLAQRVMHLRPGRNTDPHYLVWAMNAPSFYRQAAVTIGATTSPHVNLADIRRFILPRPPFEEQRHIGETLRRHDRRIKGEQREAAKLSRVKHGLMEDLLTGRVRVTKLLKEAAE